MYLEIVDAEGLRRYTDPTQAIAYLSQHPAHLRLDLHGVLDLLPSDVPIPGEGAICISYVGSIESPVYSEALQDIQQRCKTAQISYGVLVFCRGRGSARHHFVAEGSKAWVNHWIPRGKHCVFQTCELRHTSEHPVRQGERDTMNVKQSQGWMRNQTMQSDDYVAATRMSGVFIDDSMDHLRSTSVLSPDITCIQFNLDSPVRLLELIARLDMK
jgi:hypothetical protein